jgi:hypothetical protein
MCPYRRGLRVKVWKGSIPLETLSYPRSIVLLINILEDRFISFIYADLDEYLDALKYPFKKRTYICGSMFQIKPVHRPKRAPS